MKNAFTMIELVFVIVILGILAAVAIPKLAATRDDAKVSMLAQNIGTAVGEISSYTISKGAADKNFLLMSNAMQKMKNSGNAVLSDNKSVISIDGVDCISIDVVKNATNDDLKVSFISSTNQKCLSLQSAIGTQNYFIKLRGSGVVY
ncbi:type II secretion system protein [Sulfurimonas sp.]|uniref:type II secretion system protein n=1 Tax=Sulfurimonas sp. TaxID=2022749 RepID=UPI00261C4740|nr:type II secretion system protein [Sulfurimonas sp.]